MNHIKWLWELWRKHKRFLLLLFVMTILSTSVAVAFPFLFKYLIDTVSNVLSEPAKHIAPQKEIYRIVWIFIIVGFVKMIASLYPGMRAYMNLLFEYILRNKYFENILGKDYKFFNSFRTGDLVTRLTDDLSDFPKICWFACSGIFRAFDSFSKIVFCLAVMFALSWKLTLLAVIPLPLMIAVFYVVSDRLYKTFRKNQEAISEINNQLEMSFSGIRIIKAFVSENKYIRFFNDALSNRFDTEMRLVKLNTALHMIYEYIDRFAQIGVIMFGGYMVVKGEITVGTFYAFYTYLAMLIYPILDLPQLFVSGKQAFVNIDRLDEIKDFPTSLSKEQTKDNIAKVESIEFRDVTFCYDEKGCVVNNVNFKVGRGEKTVIIGPVGSGKSTILGLLTGLLKPEKGEVLINGRNIDEYNMTEFRNRIGYVPQEPLLFSGTIRDNVYFGTEDIEEDIYKRVIGAVHMDTEIDQFTSKHETKIGQRGISLSGGQKQRLAIARALIKKPEVLILDDITASLDADNEERLWNEINDMFSDITCFIVSHRLSTIRYVDNVIFLDSGNLIGMGEHKDLIGSSPEYRMFIEEHYLKEK